MKIKVTIQDFFGEKIGFHEIDASCLFEMFGFKFAAHKSLEYSVLYKWRVTELSTGFAIGKGKMTRIEAIKEAKIILEREGKEKVKKAVKKQLRRLE